MIDESGERDPLELYENLIHDMKAPLSILINNLDAIQRSRSLSKKLQPRFESARQCTHQLFKIINDLSDYDKIIRGVFRKQYQNRDIVAALSRTVELAEGLAQDRGIKVAFSSSAAEKIMAFDPELLNRIIFNLLSNAFKFTAAGGIVTICLREEAERVWITIQDSGKGISPDMMARLYQRFEWESRDENPRGSGLGLAIVRELIREMNGGMEVRSSGDGVECILWLPVFLTDGSSQPFPCEDYYSEHMVQIELSDEYV